jgi:PAS domain S-box-containing protein
MAERARVEEAYRVLVEHSLQGLLIVQDERIIFANPGLTALSGYTLQELLSFSPNEVQAILHPKDRERVWQNLQDRLAGKPVPSRYELRFVCKDGAVRWVEALLSRVDYRDRPAVQIACMDISERVEAQEMLLLTQFSVDHVLDRVAWLGADGRFLYVNESMRKEIGRSRQETLSMNVADANLDYIPEQWIANWQSLKNRGPVVVEAQRLDKRGRSHSMEVCANYVQFGRHELICLYGRDITARARAEDALRHHAERLRVLHEIDRGILAAQSPQTIAQAAVTHILQLIPCQRADVVLYDPNSGEIVVLAVDTGVETAFGKGTRYRLDPSVDEFKRLRQGQVVVWREALLWGKEVQAVFAAEGLRSAVSVPLMVQEKWLGVLNLSFEASRPTFTDEHETIARQVADQLSIAIQHAHLYEQVQRYADELEQRVADRMRELSVLREVVTASSQSLDLDSTLERSLSWVLKALKGDAGAIHLLDTSAVSRGKPPPLAIQHLAVQQEIPFNLLAQVELLPTDEEVGGWVIEHDKVLILPDITSDPRVTVEGLTTPRAYAGVPMRVAGQVVGVLSIFREIRQPPFSAEDVVLLASVASQIGMVVEYARLRRQARQLAVIEERGRLARELHDSVTQALYSMVLLTEGGRRLSKSGDLENARLYFSELEEIAIQALKEMRLLVYELRPSALEREGLVGALQRRLDAVEGRAGVKARLLVEGEIELTPPVETALYGLAQEALNNALKHASATALTVRVRTVDGGRVELEIVDDGQGFDRQENGSQGGMGLLTMRERAEQVGGTLQVLSAPGQGTTVRVTVG